VSCPAGTAPPRPPRRRPPAPGRGLAARTPAGPAPPASATTDTAALAALLDLVAAQLPHLDPAVRRHVVASCRTALGEQV
jgi:hypothetical protein